MTFTIPRDFTRYKFVQVYIDHNRADVCEECPVYDDVPPHTYKTWVAYMDGDTEYDYAVCRIHAREWRRFARERDYFFFRERLKAS